MPRKDRVVLEEKRRSRGIPKTRRVPIVGVRVRVGLLLAGISNADAARQLKMAGVKVTAQAINDIVNGRTKSTQARIRSGLAKLAGRPFSAKFLGGEQEIEVPPMPIVLSSRDHWWAWGFADAQNLTEAKTGLAYRPPHSDDGTPPLYEVYALVLYSRIEHAWKRDFPDTPVSRRLNPLLRKLLALSHWRGLVTIRDDAASKIDRSFWADAGAFAEAMLTATSLILKPWFDGELKPRRYMVSALHHFLEASIALDEALLTRETVPNAQALRRKVSAKWFGDGRLLAMKELLDMAAFGTYQASLAEVSNQGAAAEPRRAGLKRVRDAGSKETQ